MCRKKEWWKKEGANLSFQVTVWLLWPDAAHLCISASILLTCLALPGAERKIESEANAAQTGKLYLKLMGK